MKILHQDCDISIENKKTLPRDSYIVCYVSDNLLKYDISRGSIIELFDYYYDTYRNVKSIYWSKGTVNPRNYDYITKQNVKKK